MPTDEQRFVELQELAKNLRANGEAIKKYLSDDDWELRKYAIETLGKDLPTYGEAIQQCLSTLAKDPRSAARAGLWWAAPA